MQSRYHLRPCPRPSPYNRWQGNTQPRYVAALSYLTHHEEQANVVINPTSGQALEYQHLIHGPNSDTWIKALANNLGRLSQGVGTRMPTGTNTVFFAVKSSISQGRKFTYARMVASIIPTKAEVNRVRVTVGRDRLDFPGATTTHCISLTTTKCLLNSTISTLGAHFMNLDIKDFYYGTVMARYEYIKLAPACILDKIIDQYSLRTLSFNGWVYLDIRKGMPVLKQAGRIANNQLKAHLAHFGFVHVPRTLVLWKHVTKLIIFSLAVDNFGFKYIGKENADHLIQALQTSKPSPSTGPVTYSVDSPLTGTMPHATMTSPCQNMYKQPCSNYNIQRPNTHNMPHTPGQNPLTEHMYNTHKTTTLLLSYLQKKST